MAKQSLQLNHFKSGQVGGVGRHNQREPGDNHSNKDIDDTMTHLNYDLHNSEKISFADKVNERIAEGYTGTRKIQSNANVMEGIVLQAKKEYFDKMTPEKEREFFQTGYEHICEKYGKENVISAIVHKDETAPHMHINFVPLKDGRLCSADLFRRQEMIDLHTDMHRALKERGFDIERGENEIEKREHLTPQKFKLVELEREVAQKEQSLESRQQKLESDIKFVYDKSVEVNEFQAKYKELKENVVFFDKDVLEIHSRSKEKNHMWGKGYDIILQPEDYEKLKATAIIGTNALERNTKLQQQVEKLTEENKKLEHEVFSLQGKNKGFEVLLKDHQIAKRVNDIQNPHLAAYREIKARTGITSNAIRFGGDDRFENIAYEMMKEKKFDRNQIQECLRTDLNRDDAQNAMSGANMRINQDQAKEKAEQERLQARADQERARAEAQQRIIDRQLYIEKNPNIKKYQDYKNKGMSDTDIIFRMTKIEKMPEYKVRDAIVDGGQSREYATKCISEVNKVKIPTKTQFKQERTSSGGGCPAIADNVRKQLQDAQDRSPTPIGGGLKADCFPLDDDELERIERAMERGGMER